MENNTKGFALAFECAREGCRGRAIVEPAYASQEEAAKALTDVMGKESVLGVCDSCGRAYSYNPHARGSRPFVQNLDKKYKEVPFG